MIKNRLNQKFCVLIKYDFMKIKRPQVSKETVDNNNSESAPSIRVVYEWFLNFRNVDISTSVAEHS